MPFLPPTFMRSVSEPGYRLDSNNEVLQQLSEENHHLATSVEDVPQDQAQPSRPSYTVAKQALKENDYSEQDIKRGFEIFFKKNGNATTKSHVAKEVAGYILAEQEGTGKIPICGTLKGKGVSKQGSHLLEFELDIPSGEWGPRKKKTIRTTY